MKRAMSVCLVAAVALCGCAYKGYNPYRDGDPGLRDHHGVAMIDPYTKDGRVSGYEREGYSSSKTYYVADEQPQSYTVHDDDAYVHHHDYDYDHHHYDDCYYRR